MQTTDGWEDLTQALEQRFKKKLNLEAILLLIGMQEMNFYKKGIKKEVKVDLMHIGLCKLLEGEGYYEKVSIDEEGWPIYELKKPLPDLSLTSQIYFIQSKMVEYFRKIDFIS
ncbi:MAG: hypothetical protein KatS3mg035_1385 [Bacteroidia bacterium]|nr:MAG: hypothetical protein KatS3mg035_1385 [Bacteroidia bacterium]